MSHVVGRSVTLREYREEDFPEIRAWVNDPEVAQYLSDIFAAAQSETVTQKFFDRVTGSPEPNAFWFVISDTKTEKYLGQIDLVDINWINRRGTLGIVIPNPANRGRGIGREALSLLAHYAFSRLNLHKIELRVFDYNTRAIEMYKRVGFKEEGRLREHIFRAGCYHDTMEMGLLASEFAGVDEFLSHPELHGPKSVIS